MNFLDAIKSAFINWRNFSGRASRSEFWYYALFVFIVDKILRFLKLELIVSDTILSNIIFGAIIPILFLVPYCGVLIRRLHDIDKSTWWFLLMPFMIAIGSIAGVSYSFGLQIGFIMTALVCLIGFPIIIVAVIFLSKKGTNGPNRFGTDPLANEPINS
jgi:uncharacterized membrane protein YhaH (DUF805 family)